MRNPDKQPDNCTMTIRKEWINVNCTGDVKRIKKIKPPPGVMFNKHYGVEYNDYALSFQPGKNANVNIRLYKGRSPKLWICYPNSSSEFSVSWPASESRPTKIALTKGPAC